MHPKYLLFCLECHQHLNMCVDISGLMVIVFEMMDDNCFCVDDGIFVDDGVCDDNGVLMMDVV